MILIILIFIHLLIILIHPEGGTHEDGVKRALTRIINNYAKKSKIFKR
jgi:DNA gyrase/topoisomerase IV subunit B